MMRLLPEVTFTRERVGDLDGFYDTEADVVAVFYYQSFSEKFMTLAHEFFHAMIGRVPSSILVLMFDDWLDFLDRKLNSLLDFFAERRKVKFGLIPVPYKGYKVE